MLIGETERSRRSRAIERSVVECERKRGGRGVIVYGRKN
jgi:hypothetical protein